MKFKIAVLLFLLVGVLFQLAKASDFEVYVMNRPFSGDVISIDGTLYAELVPLAKALYLQVTQKNDAVVIGKAPETIQAGKIFLDGKLFTDAFRNDDEKWYVRIRSFVESAGAQYSVNQETGIVDVIPGVTGFTEQSDVKPKKEPPVPEKSIEPVVTETPEAAVPKAFRFEQFDHLGVRFRYPKSWMRSDGGEEEGSLILCRLFPDKKGTEIVIREERYFSALRFGSLDQVSKLQLKSLGLLPKFKLLETAPCTLGALPGNRALFTIFHPPTGLTIKGSWFWTVRGFPYGKSTFVTVVDTVEYLASTDDYDRYFPAVTDLLNSMELAAPPLRTESKTKK